LLIENAGERRDSLRKLLESSGCQVETVANGATGLRKAIASRPEAAIVGTDIRPSGGYAEALCLRVVFGNEIVLIATSRPGLPIDRQRARAVGFDHLLSSDDDPAELRELLSVVKSYTASPEVSEANPQP
jgi:CheY-like chemotaxis protein